MRHHSPRTFFRLSPSDYEGLHRRYTQWLADAPHHETLAKGPDKEQREQLSALFNQMMRALFRSEGATLAIELLDTPAMRSFIEAHAGVLDSSFKQTRMSEAMRPPYHPVITPL